MAVSGLFTDFYELTMMQGYFLVKNNPQVAFDMFYRNNPFDGGYSVFTGLQSVLEQLESFSFSDEDVDYLKSLGKFAPEFLDYLKSYRFGGTVYAMKEGSVVFPQEPLVRIHGSLIDCQLIEGLLLNTLNFQTLIATKSARVCQAAGNTAVMEFGLRRAQGINGANSASRAAYVGGVALTSNTFAAKEFGIPTGGTMAHSWVMSFDSELEAFREFARIYPDNCILLIDTYDTLESGIDNAIAVGLEQKAKGLGIGVRIDSGDLSYLARIIRKRLDEAGLNDATICVSNDLTEQIIQALVTDGVPIDSWGVGTHLATGGSQSSLNGVYKLSAKMGPDGAYAPAMKVSNSFEKTTNPGIKQVYRFFGSDGQALGDLITLYDEHMEPGQDYMFYHPFSDDTFKMRRNAYAGFTPLLEKMMENGRICVDFKPLSQIRSEVKENLQRFHPSYRRFINPHIYKVSLSSRLKTLKRDLIEAARLR